jgi:hypothetical protein
VQILDWDRYNLIASRFKYKIGYQERDDLKHTIILKLAQSEQNNGNEPLTYQRLFRIANNEYQKYMRQYRHNRGIISLSRLIGDDDGNVTELIETIPDDQVTDIDSWVNARMFLQQCPERVLMLADKILSGKPLSNSEHQCLWRFRQKEDLRREFTTSM